MSMDGLSLLAVVHELQALVDGRIDKIQQPEKETLLFTVRAGGSNHKLLLCSHPENGRVQLTEQSYVNPPEPPMFCMLLRKRLLGGKIISIIQPLLDRLLFIDIESRDELGDFVRQRIVVELMGKYSNICFLNEQDILVDCAKHVNVGMSSVRLLLPGVKYLPPPAQEKQNPLEAHEEDFLAALQGRGSVHKLLTANFFGLSPDCARQIVLRWAGEAELNAETLDEMSKKGLAQYLYRLYQSFNNGQFSPTLLFNKSGTPVAVYPFLPALPQELCKPCKSMGEALDEFYLERDRVERFRRRGASMQRIIKNTLERCYKKLAVYEQALAQEENLEALRVEGELIMANAHALKRGMQAAPLLNYYEDPPAEIIVTLDERLSPQENAQRLFKRYQKGKAAKTLAITQSAQTKTEIEYLEGQLDNLDKCTLDDELEEIREELVREGYIRPEQKKNKRKLKPSKPLHVKSTDGLDIYVGKNNQQNDNLTLRFAQSNDIWMHTRNIPGSHVIIRADGTIPERTLKEAAMLAAYYSKSRASAGVPVDYCERKFVKKPSGAKPGMVIYTTNRTIYITPTEEAVKALEVVAD
ncbi:NFACT family protein [Eubacteriales bacterium OttesenSCG-928-K08]|nr:NFACT family protein [Eubacteriales bacterium OttesenSCG-928-K08]